MLELLLIATILAGVLVAASQLARRSSGLDRAKFAKRWQEVTSLMEGGVTGQKMAVIEADKLLDQALKAKGVAGETMGDRLKSAGAILGDQDSVWQAHRLRNRLVHEETKINKRQAARALRSINRSLKKLGAL